MDGLRGTAFCGHSHHAALHEMHEGPALGCVWFSRCGRSRAAAAWTALISESRCLFTPGALISRHPSLWPARVLLWVARRNHQKLYKWWAPGLHPGQSDLIDLRSGRDTGLFESSLGDSDMQPNELRGHSSCLSSPQPPCDPPDTRPG